jgi:triacylglycerol lipase
VTAVSRRRLVIVVVVLLVAGVIGLVLVRLRPEPVVRSFVPQDQPGPVLLVPGYGGSTAALKALAERLEAAGRVAVLVPAIGDGTGDLRAEAAAVAAAAAAQLATGAPSVDVVGYSAGGVTTRIWQQDLGGARITRRVVTLGSPHHGTRVAALGQIFAGASCAVACQQLVPGSDLLDELSDTTPGPTWVSIWTDQDTLVTPPQTARLKQAINIVLQQICPDAVVSHAQLPTDPLVQGLVLQALGVAEPIPPTASDCAALRG